MKSFMNVGAIVLRLSQLPFETFSRPVIFRGSWRNYDKR